MASLRKDGKKRSPYWIACFTTADGRRLQKSTKQTDRKKALEVCLALERSEAMARQGTLTEGRTRELLAQVLERTTGDTLPFFTLEGFLRNWLRGKEVSKAANTVRNYRQVTEAFIAHLGGRAKLNIAAITAKDVSNFRDAEIASGKNPNSVRHGLKNLRVPFNSARRQGIITTNPAEAVELPPATKGEDGAKTEKHVFTPEQIEALLNAATAHKDDRDWRGAILFAYYTGARLQDVANITWGAVDLPARFVTFRAQKTGKEACLPLHHELEAHLLALPAPDSGRAHVFPALAGKTSAFLAKRFAPIMRGANIANAVISEARGAKGRRVWALSFHSLRHSCNSAMANAGVAQEVRNKITGHASDKMNAHYTHHELAPLRAAIELIPGISRKAARK